MVITKEMNKVFIRNLQRLDNMIHPYEKYEEDFNKINSLIEAPLTQQELFNLYEKELYSYYEDTPEFQRYLRFYSTVLRTYLK